MTKCQKPMLKEVLRYFRAPSCQRKLPIVERLHESEHVPLEEPDVDTGGAVHARVPRFRGREIEVGASPYSQPARDRFGLDAR